MERLGSVVAELDANIYRIIIGKLRKLLPTHLRTEIERIRNDKGDKIIRIWSQYSITKKLIDEVLREHVESKPTSEDVDKKETINDSAKMPLNFEKHNTERRGV